MELGIRVTAEASSRPARARRAAGPAAARRRPLASRRTTCRSSTAREQDVEVVSGPRSSTCARCRADDFPKLPGGRRATRRTVPAPALRRDGRPRGRARPRATRRARTSPASSSPRRAGAADGRHRLLPPARQGDELESALEGALEANVPARTLQELARIVAERGRDRDRDRRARAPGHLHGRRRRRCPRGCRGPLPELQAAAARDLRARAARSTAPSCSTSSRRISLLAQKNAPLRMKFEEGDARVRPRRPTSARRASRCPRRSRARRSRSASTPSSSATASRAPSPRSSCSS